LRKINQKKVYSIIMSTPISELPYNTATNTVSATTELPPRDIPRETVNHTTDAQVTPTYIPPKQQEYIEQQPVHYQPPAQSKMDRLFEEFKLPILLSVLYFIFQMPTVHSFIIRVFPSIAHAGELTTLGVMVKSVLFGLSYHVSMFFMDYLNQP
jgi:hypothetical protein